MMIRGRGSGSTSLLGQMRTLGLMVARFRAHLAADYTGLFERHHLLTSRAADYRPRSRPLPLESHRSIGIFACDHGRVAPDTHGR